MRSPGSSTTDRKERRCPHPHPLAAFHAADLPYRHAREELRALEYARDRALLDARESGLGEDEVCAVTGLEVRELRAALTRADAADAAGRLVTSEPARNLDTVTLTAVYEAVEAGWVHARVAGWPGVVTAAPTRAGARALLRDAAREWLLSLGARDRADPAAERVECEALELHLAVGDVRSRSSDT